MTVDDLISITADESLTLTLSSGVEPAEATVTLYRNTSDGIPTDSIGAPLQCVSQKNPCDLTVGASSLTLTVNPLDAVVLVAQIRYVVPLDPTLPEPQGDDMVSFGIAIDRGTTTG
jgi:hypothetical protein